MEFRFEKLEGHGKMEVETVAKKSYKCNHALFFVGAKVCAKAGRMTKRMTVVLAMKMQTVCQICCLL